MSAASGQLDYELAGELKFGQVGVANLRVIRLDIEKLAAEMRERVRRAPRLFGRAAVIIDFGALSTLPGEDRARQLIIALRDAGAIPVALAWGGAENEALALKLGLPLLAKFRAQYEQQAMATEPAPAAEPTPAPVPSAPTPPAANVEPGLMIQHPVRSGQQIYAERRDLTVLSTVGAGAEIISDGSIHIYGALRGRALAGARGNTNARIFCRAFHSELVAVAGHYKVLEDVPKALYGKPVQIWLEQDELKIAELD